MTEVQTGKFAGINQAENLSVDPARVHFHSLDQLQQIEAITRLAATGMGDYDISHASGLSVEFIRQLLEQVPQ